MYGDQILISIAGANLPFPESGRIIHWKVAAGLVAQAMKVTGSNRQIILLCDSWYPKAEAAALVEQFDNLEMVCNARVDTALYGLPPAKTGKKGRPGKRGDRIQLNEIFPGGPKSGDWLIGMMPVIISLWKDKTVYAFVTAPKNGKGSRRLFLCTANPRTISFDWETLTKQHIPMEQKMSFICRWLGMA